MAVVTIKLPHHTYDIIIEPGCIDRLGSLTRDVAPHDRCALLGDQQVFDIYGQRSLDALKSADYQPVSAFVPPGEKHKTLDTISHYYQVMLDHKLERRSPVVALGGGISGDTVGMAAATYLRGVPFIQCPTSLLAMVDASVGGKVGVNVPQGKNLIGAFYQPAVVIMDPLTLHTLPPRELRCGLAECIKHGVIRDASLLTFINDNLANIQAMTPDTLVELIRQNVQIKASVVMEDEKESGVRAHLNFGHTFAHAIEATGGYGEVHHGEAVSLGMVAAAHMAQNLGLCDDSVTQPLTEILNAVGLPTRATLPDTETLLASMTHDKKVKDNRINFVLPTRMGEVVINNQVPTEAVAAAWDFIRE